MTTVRYAIKKVGITQSENTECAHRAAPIVLQMLGEDGIHFSGRQSERIAPQAAELIAFVLLSPRREVRRPAILGALWPSHDPRTARRRLSRLLWRCQQILPSDIPVVKGESISITDQLRSDYHAAEEVIDRIMRGVCPKDQELMPLHRRLLTDVTAEWTEDHRTHWDRRRTQALERVGEMCLTEGRARSAALHAGYLADWQPLNERAHQLLFQAALADGMPGRAIEIFRRYRRTLRRELGVEPSPSFIEHARAAERGRPAA
ncbi:bacterial transcriptional activator domain-containing protein [Streptomyces sp. A3M-1-3]|uniref:AfsR/SARP family transcriptional regulator n=1 Tax=Streptomyces sp. A3M-1-3 TaxID=2962044 RepID=UPI0020B66E80|nr:bacterial transcriptional activator domain-containing protein [Streptomyces sp. A3M-1-3]MCP3816822.1 bacterial transcriptional activator domain-containing protein [Streptomyces sp. A3M-1-3]